jgi:hypothetical protein
MLVENSHTVFLILKIQVCSRASASQCILAKEGILEYGEHTVIRIPLSSATPLNGGPVAGERYFIRYTDGIENNPYGPEFYFLGVRDEQLVFSSALN